MEIIKRRDGKFMVIQRRDINKDIRFCKENGLNRQWTTPYIGYVAVCVGTLQKCKDYINGTLPVNKRKSGNLRRDKSNVRPHQSERAAEKIPG